ncbi:MAG: EAL domain-containing protein [Treponema sp.]|nr:EAL domain-containing protein [Treponema sp.]
MRFSFTKKQCFVFIVSSVILLSVFLLLLILNSFFLLNRADSVLPVKNFCFVLKAGFFIVSLQLILLIFQSNFISEIDSISKLDVTGTNTKLELEHKIKKIEDNGNLKNISVIMLDLNDLKYINDHFGHDKGDVIILNFAQMIKKAVPHDVFVARFGGDEFICIDENSSVEKVEQFKDKLNISVNNYNKNNDIKISYAFGYEINDSTNHLTMKELFRVADQNMYKNKREIKSEDLRYSGKKDSLTGLLSNENFAQIFEQYIGDSFNERQLVLEFTDFSNFRYVNEFAGSAQGDEILKFFARRLVESRNTVCASRLFSDYFVSLIDVTSLSKREIEYSVYVRNKSIENSLMEEFKLSSFSINSGLYLVNSAVSSVAEMIQFANVARNNAKNQNIGVCLYSSEIDAFERKRQEILSAFKVALKNNEFAVYLQPKISTDNDRISGVEALSRWTFEGKVRWTPDEYIPALETSGDIILLDYYVFDKVFAWLHERSYSGLGYIRISLNISAVHLNNPSLFFEYLRKLELKYKIPSEYISFELSEAAYMQKKETVSIFIQALHGMGYRISLDDFKSNYLSMKVLENTPFDEVKIRHNFEDKDFSFSDRMILKSVIGMIKEMDKVVVCQGIENKNQIDFLKNEKCDVIQGFYYSRPIPLDSFNDVCSKFA